MKSEQQQQKKKNDVTHLGRMSLVVEVEQRNKEEDNGGKADDWGGKRWSLPHWSTIGDFPPFLYNIYRFKSSDFHTYNMVLHDIYIYIYLFIYSFGWGVIYPFQFLYKTIKEEQ